MLQDKRAIVAIAFVTAAIGFLAEFWPLCVLGVVVAAVGGRWVVAILLGLLLDIAYGIPVEPLLRYVYLPFTLLAVAVALVRVAFASRLRKNQTDTL